MSTRCAHLVPLAFLAAAVSPAPRLCAQAQGAPPDKSGYRLGNPTPRALMREMSTDRPDATESPYTVDAGHFQLEFSFVEFTRDDPADGPRTEALAVAPLNFKVGLFNSTDLQFLFDPYRRDDADGAETVEGVGDITFRLKQNLWGNDGGATALALMPFLTIPSGDDDVGREEVEGGLIVPLAVELPRGFGLGLMAELDFVHDSDANVYRAELVHTATLSHAIVGELGGYIEYIGVEPLSAADPYLASFSTGLTLGLGPDAQLDAGAVFGLTDEAEDVTVFAGLSVRF